MLSKAASGRRTLKDRQEWSTKDRRELAHAGLFHYHMCLRGTYDSAPNRFRMEDIEPPIACKLTDPEFRERREGILTEVKNGVAEMKELEDGYAYRFPSDSEWLTTLSKLIAVERECCPFLQFQLRLEPADGPIWLELTGPHGTKDFLNSIFGE